MKPAKIFDGFLNDIDRAGFLAEFKDELCNGIHFERVMAGKQQLEAARANPERRFIDGIGQVKMTITPTAYHYWGQRLGYQCWKDKQFQMEFLRDNPEVRVRSRSSKTMIGAAPTARHSQSPSIEVIQRGGRKYTKTYAM